MQATYLLPILEEPLMATGEDGQPFDTGYTLRRPGFAGAVINRWGRIDEDETTMLTLVEADEAELAKLPGALV